MEEGEKPVFAAGKKTEIDGVAPHEAKVTTFQEEGSISVEIRQRLRRLRTKFDETLGRSVGLANEGLGLYFDEPVFDQ